MSTQDTPPVKRRESRSGSRKVSTLSAEQLERKRANDREAQRSIRQRTKDHIEQLEAQVSSLKSQIAEMWLRKERFDKLIQHNAFLENEVRRLKGQVASLTGRPQFAASTEPIAPFRGGWPLEETSHGVSSPVIPTTGPSLPPHSTTSSDPPRRSEPSATRRASHQHDWRQPYPSTRSPSLGAASDPEFHNRMEPYAIDSHLHQGQRIGPPVTQISFGGTSSPPQQHPGTAFSQLPYSTRSLPISLDSPNPQPNTARVYRPSASAYPQPQQRDPTCDYPWGPP
jgi:TolA-binding protein